MNKEVQDYIREKKALREKLKREAEQEERDELLIDLGFYTKDYAPKGADTSLYPEVEWDEEKGCDVFYRIIPYKISDEEYQELLELEEDEEEEEEELISKSNIYNPIVNPIAKLMLVVAAIIFIAGIVTGLVFISEIIKNHGEDNEKSIAIAVICFVSAFIDGSLFLGIAEIINRLDSIDIQLEDE